MPQDRPGSLSNDEVYALTAYLLYLNELIDENQDNGLLHLARARMYFSTLESAKATSRPVLQNMAMRDLEQAAAHCPDHPQIEILRIYNSQQLQARNQDYSRLLARFANESLLHHELAVSYRQSGDSEKAIQLAESAWSLNPLDSKTLCFYHQLLQSKEGNHESDELRYIENRMKALDQTQPIDCQ